MTIAFPATSSAQVSLDYHYVNFLGPIQVSNSIFGNFNSFVNSANAATTNEGFRLNMEHQPWCLLYVKKSKGKVVVLSPKISLSVNDQENDVLGEYF